MYELFSTCSAIDNDRVKLKAAETSKGDMRRTSRVDTKAW